MKIKKISKDSYINAKALGERLRVQSHLFSADTHRPLSSTIRWRGGLLRQTQWWETTVAPKPQHFECNWRKQNRQADRMRQAHVRPIRRRKPVLSYRRLTSVAPKVVPRPAAQPVA